MATRVKRIETLVVPLEARVGSLANVYHAFKEAGVNVLGSWGYQMGPAGAEAIIYPSDLEKAQAALTRAGYTPRVGHACYAEGDDQLGVYLDVLRKVAQAGVNLEATDAFCIGRRFGTVLFVQEEEYPALCKALGC